MHQMPHKCYVWHQLLQLCNNSTLILFILYRIPFKPTFNPFLSCSLSLNLFQSSFHLLKRARRYGVRLRDLSPERQSQERARATTKEMQAQGSTKDPHIRQHWAKLNPITIDHQSPHLTSTYLNAPEREAATAEFIVSVLRPLHFSKSWWCCWDERRTSKLVVPSTFSTKSTDKSTLYVGVLTQTLVLMT